MTASRVTHKLQFLESHCTFTKGGEQGDENQAPSDLSTREPLADLDRAWVLHAWSVPKKCATLGPVINPVARRDALTTRPAALRPFGWVVNYRHSQHRPPLLVRRSWASSAGQPPAGVALLVPCPRMKIVKYTLSKVSGALFVGPRVGWHCWRTLPAQPLPFRWPQSAGEAGHAQFQPVSPAPLPAGILLRHESRSGFPA